MLPRWWSLEWILRWGRGSRKGGSDYSVENGLERTVHLGQYGFLISREHFIVGRNEDQPNENEQRLFFQSLLYKGISHHHLCFGRDSMAGRGLGKLQSGKRFQMCPERPQLSWRAVGRLTRRRTSYVICQGCIFGLFQLALCWKRGKQLGKLSVIDSSSLGRLGLIVKVIV